MKRMTLLAVVGVATLALYALAQQTATTAKPETTTGQAPAMQGCMAMMQKAGMDPVMMQRMQVMMRARKQAWTRS